MKPWFRYDKTLFKVLKCTCVKNLIYLSKGTIKNVFDSALLIDNNDRQICIYREL